MSLNTVTNNQPQQAIALQLDAIPAQLDQPVVNPPRGGIGIQTSAITSQLAQGNPGGVDAVGGFGINIDATS